MPERADLEQLASRISDGERIDWDEVDAGAADDTARPAIDNLRILEDVARLHRQGHEERPPIDATIGGGPAEATDLAGIESWGPLEISGKVGEGAFGEVYRAWDPKLEREVALKLLKKGPTFRSEVAATVVREGRLLARVSHPNVVIVYGAESHDGRVGLWMELVRGRSLDELVAEQGKFGAREATLIGLDLCRALAAVHLAGLVHRDVKARNVMRQEGGRIVLMDFGAGREVQDLEQGRDHSISGTPLYLPPEVYLGGKSTPRSDIYSLGVLLFHLVTDDYPVQASSLLELRDAHARREARLLRDLRSDLPEAFINIVERALAWEPEQRFATAGEMERALSHALGVDSGPASPEAPRRRRGRGLAIAAALVACMLGLTVLARVAGWGPFGVPARSAGEPTVPAGALVRPESPVAPATAALPGAPHDGEVGADSSAGADAHRAAATPERLPAASTTAAASDLYAVQAAVIRLDKQGRRERLEQGAKLALGDWLSLEFEASRDVYLYVINEDEQGQAYALFPLPDFDLQNPLPGGLRHEIPGRIEGKPASWEVDTHGGREHLMLLASAERLVDFESEMARLARPRPGQMAVPIPAELKARLRGLGGLRTRPETSEAVESIDRLFDMAQPLANDSDVVRGAWLRRFDLENPAR